MNTTIPDDIVRIFDTYRRIHNEVIAAHHDLREDRYELPTNRLQIEGPNPYYGKTLSGYVVEWYYSHPHKVHTPEGEYTFFSGNCSVPPSEILEEIDERLVVELGLVLGREMRYTTGPCGGVVGPYYKVVGTPDFVVPETNSPMLDGKEPDSNTKMNAMAFLLEELIRSAPEEVG